MDGTTLVTFGKFRGLTFAEVQARHPEYCAWAQELPNPNGALQLFVDYLAGSAEQVEQLPKAHASASAPMTQLGSDEELRSVAPAALPVAELIFTVEIRSQEEFQISPGGFIDKNVWKTVSNFRHGSWSTEQKAWIFPALDFAEVTNWLMDNTEFSCHLDLPPPWVLEHFPCFCAGSEKERKRFLEDKAGNPAQTGCCGDASSVALRQGLFQYQQDGIAFGIQHDGRCLIGDEMGLGKTVQALGIVTKYVEEWPCLVIAPSSMRYTWQDMICSWVSGVDREQVQVIRNGKDAMRQGNLFTVVSYDLAQKHERFRCRPQDGKPYSIVIVDESHYMKNGSSKRSKAVVALCQSARRAVLLSGTPAMNRAGELYPQLAALMPNSIPEESEFCQRFCTQDVNHFNGHTFKSWGGSRCVHELNVLLTHTVMIRRLKDEVLQQLPSKRRQRIVLDPAQLDTKIMTQLGEIRDQMKSAKADEPWKVGSGLPELFKLTATAKIVPVLDHLETMVMSGTKFLCFCHHHHMFDACEQKLKDLGVRLVRIDGKVPEAKRHDLVNEFQTDGGPQVALLSITACSTGLTLTAASTVVFAELYWVPGIMLQAEDRVHRIGQKNACLVQYLIAPGSLDERMFKLLDKKSKDLSGILNGAEGGLEADVGSTPVKVKRTCKDDHIRDRKCPRLGDSARDVVAAGTSSGVSKDGTTAAVASTDAPLLKRGRGRPRGSTKNKASVG